MKYHLQQLQLGAWLAAITLITLAAFTVNVHATVLTVTTNANTVPLTGTGYYSPVAQLFFATSCRGQ